MKVLNSGKALIVAALAIFSMNFAYAQPANDACSGAIAITCGQTITASNAAATNDAVPACGLSAPRKGVWYTITGTGGLITLSTCSATTNFDTQIAVYTGACGALTCVASNDNAGACTNFFGRLSTVSFTSTFGTVYRIMVAGKLSASGTFTLAATCAVVAPPNDDCANSILVTCGSTTTGSTVGSTADAVGTCNFNSLNTAGGVWYSVVGNGGTVTASLCGSGYDTRIGVFTGSCGALTCVTSNDDFCGLQSQAAFSSTAGTTYYILVTGYSTAVGNFTLNVTCAAPPPPPTGNCDCNNGTPYLTVTAPSTTTPLTISSCTFGGEYNTINGAVSGRTYVVTSSIATDYLTVRQGTPGGAVLACGTTPLTITATANGPIYLHVNTNSTCGTQSECRGTTITCTSCVTTLSTSTDLPETGLDVREVSGSLNVGDIYPNPAQFGQAFMNIATPEEAVASIQLFDQAGRMVRNMETELYSGVNKVELNVNNLAQGTYFAAVRVNNEVFRKKLIVVQP